MVQKTNPLVTIVVPAYNEEQSLAHSLDVLWKYIQSLSARYRFEYVVVDDGSTDTTYGIAESFARSHENVRTVHHCANKGLSQALRTGFEQAHGDIVISIDSDLTYAPFHIARLLDAMATTGADIVVASSYMRGGRTANVPWLRRTLSVWANRWLSLAASGRISTLTCVVRAYRWQTLKLLLPETAHPEINPELLFEARKRQLKIVEIPAYLDWGSATKRRRTRLSLSRLARRTWHVTELGLRYRPVLWIAIPALFPGILPLVAALLWFFHISPGVIAAVLGATLAIQYGCLALLAWLGGHAAVTRRTTFNSAIAPCHSTRGITT
jgi:glycosyltransferase involved in cell wall biosynthesis